MKRMNKELKENIMQGTLQAFNQKGLKFTMDDIAKILGISKKTIYQVFRDKEALFLETVDYLFDRIKDSEQKIVEDFFLRLCSSSRMSCCSASVGFSRSHSSMMSRTGLAYFACTFL